MHRVENFFVKLFYLAHGFQHVVQPLLRLEIGPKRDGRALENDVLGLRF